MEERGGGRRREGGSEDEASCLQDAELKRVSKREERRETVHVLEALKTRHLVGKMRAQTAEEKREIGCAF